MITFKQYLLEDTTLTLDEAIDFVKKNCKQFLHESGYQPIYRGEKDTPSADALVRKVRKNRPPLHTNAAAHKLVDAWFKKNFGIAVRSESMFATASISHAFTFGAVSYCFPIGDFKYFWAEKSSGEAIHDTIRVIYPIERIADDDISDEMKEKHTAELMTRDVTWRTDSLAKAIHNNAELSIVCDSYILINRQAFDKVFPDFKSAFK